MPKTISFTLNNTHVEFTGQGEENLLHVLRTDFNLTGTKFGCGEGYCGACTILVDNMAMRSCQMTIADVQGKAVLTIEGLGDRDNLDPVQNAFIEHDALQCGFCTPGMILNAVRLLKENPQPITGCCPKEQPGANAHLILLIPEPGGVRAAIPTSLPWNRRPISWPRRQASIR